MPPEGKSYTKKTKIAGGLGEKGKTKGLDLPNAKQSAAQITEKKTKSPETPTFKAAKKQKKKTSMY